MTDGVLVVSAGVFMTVQDLGRAGLAHLGVSPSGAADVPAHARANALVGNAPNAATLEVTMGRCELRARESLLVAVTGPPCPMWVGSVPAPFGSPVRLARGQSLTLGEPDHGLRNYVAIRGGIAVAPVLGSRSTDVLSEIGPAVVRDGDVLPLGEAPPVGAAGFDALRRQATANPLRTASQLPREGESVQQNLTRASSLLVRMGPRDDWFTPAAVATLLAEEFEVSGQSDRVGVRLTGPVLERTHLDELESEGMVAGAVQVPTSGQPVIFLADHPTTGGYPVIAVVDTTHLPLIAQARPGDQFRFYAT